MAFLSDGRKLEFEYTVERYYGGKWHEYRACSRVGSIKLPLFTNFRCSAFGKKVMRVKSFDALHVSCAGYFTHCWDLGGMGLETVEIRAENMQRIHELLVDAGMVDYIPEVLRYVQRCAQCEEVHTYAL